jgi:uncharacterized RmlC-like cupin family protein
MTDVSIIRPGKRDAGTAQTPGMTRLAGIAASTCGASGLWMGEVSNEPGFRSGAHHHGDVESGIYVVSGRAGVRWGPSLRERAEAAAGDFIFIPPQLVHQEINLSQEEPLVLIVARGGENIVINIDMPEAAEG